MKQLITPLDASRDYVRARMTTLAGWLHRTSDGRLQPDHITYIGFVMHIPVALAIAFDAFVLAAVLLVVFGLFDALDGALARLQSSSSDAGMLLDASTDRLKEIFIYTGAAYAMITFLDQPIGAVWAVVACGASLSVSYVKAKGETAVKDTSLSTSQVNRLFADGLMRFEVRMGVIVVGLIANQLLIALIIVAILSSYTAFARLLRISRTLKQASESAKSS